MPNIAQMNRLGVATSTLAQTIRVAFEGVEIGTLTLDGEEVPFHLSLDKSNINGDEIISRLQVPNNLGQLIDVSRMVSIQESFLHLKASKAAIMAEERQGAGGY